MYIVLFSPPGTDLNIDCSGAVSNINTAPVGRLGDKLEQFCHS